MAKIRLVLDTPIYDGISLTFKAPCPCTAVDGLIVYYQELTETTSEQRSATFEFKDAHGKTLTGTGNLFSEGAYVKVILDTNNGSAYIQNADTNSYLEGKFKPAFGFRDVTEGGTSRGRITYVESGGMCHIYGDITFTPSNIELDEETRIFTFDNIIPPPTDLWVAQCFTQTQGMSEEDAYTSNVAASVKFASDGTITLFNIPAGEYTQSTTIHVNLVYSTYYEYG